MLWVPLNTRNGMIFNTPYDKKNNLFTLPLANPHDGKMILRIFMSCVDVLLVYFYMQLY